MPAIESNKVMKAFALDLEKKSVDLAKARGDVKGSFRIGDVLRAVELIQKEQAKAPADKKYGGAVGEFLKQDYQNKASQEIYGLVTVLRDAAVGITDADKGKDKPLGMLAAVIVDSTVDAGTATRAGAKIALEHFTGNPNILSNLKTWIKELFTTLKNQIFGKLSENEKVKLLNKLAEFERSLDELLTSLSKGIMPLELSQKMKAEFERFKKEELGLDKLPADVKARYETELKNFFMELDGFLKTQVSSLGEEGRRRSEMAMPAPSKPSRRLSEGASPAGEPESLAQWKALGKQMKEEAAKPKAEPAKAEPAKPKTPPAETK